MKKIFQSTRSLLLAILLLAAFTSCQKEEVIVQSLLDLSGAPLAYDDSKATKFLNVAVNSMEVSREKSVNILKIKSKSIEIKLHHPETELILFGESFLGWYINDEMPQAYQLVCCRKHSWQCHQ
ncbi:hypothetical protein BH23BAC1_BH23BAC1_48800 [soil metagenome]